jgi:hypothetical protein
MKHKVAVHCLPLKKVLLLVVVVDHMQAVWRQAFFPVNDN